MTEMTELMNSKVMEDFKNGKLPPVEVTIETNTLLNIWGGFFLAGLALIIAWNIFEKLK
jgi:hypothetical protein